MMSIWAWVCIYVVFSCVAKWIISWGGAAYIQGWRSIFIFSAENSEEWSKDQVIMMTWFFWIAFSIWFVIGVFNPDLRFYTLKRSV